MTLRRSWVLAIGTLLGLSPDGFAQQTWRVGSALFPTSDFHEIQDAFDAATSGDTIIVETRGFPYSPASTNKGFRLLSTSSWDHFGAIRVHDLPADQTFTLAGFKGIFPIEFTDCAGDVHIDNSSVTIEDMPFTRVGHLFRTSLGTSPIEVFAPPGAAAYTCVGTTTFPLPVPPFGELWFDAASLLVVASGTVDANGKFDIMTALHGAWPLGTVSTWQAVLVDAGGVRLTLPAVTVAGEY